MIFTVVFTGQRRLFTWTPQDVLRARQDAEHETHASSGDDCNDETPDVQGT